ncbi:MAG: hypothetical protein GKS02_03715 [Alphaproteobacteria bacterium]|nr:hypothetical protein [Alphaproteobacteria bacterium]
MRYPVLQNRLSVDTAVRLLLTALMDVVLAFMFVLNTQQAAAQDLGREYYAQEPYGLSRDEVVATLDRDYREVPVAGGIATNGNIIEVFAAPDGRSWTIIVTRPDGMSSIVAEGDGWSFIEAIDGVGV